MVCVTHTIELMQFGELLIPRTNSATRHCIIRYCHIRTTPRFTRKRRTNTLRISNSRNIYFEKPTTGPSAQPRVFGKVGLAVVVVVVVVVVVW